MTVKPVSTGAGFVSKDKILGLRLQLANYFVNDGFTRANGAQEDGLSVPIIVDVGYRDGVLVNI